ncbi:MAG: hypothetical protein H0W84_13770 [Bacteroidetes bacterium]|nr:hypothetical protein [Bacteroidota bacterium]
MENVIENFELIKQISNNKKVCVIMDVTKADMAEKKIRDYVISQFSNYFNAVAFVSEIISGGKLFLL